jgi:hypothetical protein
MIPQHRVAHPFFPKVQPHAPDTVQTPSRDSLSFWGKIKYSIWEIGKMLKERNVKFAMRAGLAIALLAAPAFFDGTRQFFVENQGDWALVSVFLFLLPRQDAFINILTDFYRYVSHHWRGTVVFRLSPLLSS